MLNARDIRKNYQDRSILSGINLNIEPGSVSALLGPSGGGKTTFLRILAGLNAPDSGMVTLDGRAIYAKSGACQIWPEVTVVFQQQFLWPHLTVRQNISLAAKARTTTQTASNEMLERLECAFVFDKYPWQLSQGERARVALARALLLQPRVLLLDEVTAALDTKRAEIVGTLIRERTEDGVAVLLVTHDLAFASRWANESYRLEDGELHPTRLSTVSDVQPEMRVA